MRMKPFFLIVCLMLFTFSFACGKKKKKQQNLTQTDSVWMQYNETKCQNPWQLNWFTKPTEEQLRGAVKSQIEKHEVKILDIRSTYDDGMISCEACTCPNGRTYYVLVKSDAVATLEAFHFIKTTTVPEANNPDKTR